MSTVKVEKKKPSFDVTKKTLVIVESPNKVSTLTKIFKDIGFKDITVMASKGHITKIKDGGSYWNSGINPKSDFKANYIVDPTKEKVVASLKAAVKGKEIIYLATDPDREGEDISWHLKTVLNIGANRYKRITFHEITKSAVEKALLASSNIDMNMVDSCEARKLTDKIFGYRVSPQAQDHVGAQSVGRCQSPAEGLIVAREKEITNFVPEKYYDIYLHFAKNKSEFKAKYIGTTEKLISSPIKERKIVDEILDRCKGGAYTVKDIERREYKENPKPPFTTATFQQEANRTFKMSVNTAMKCAQELFEGITIMGEHVALITYHRTDDDTMSPEFADTLKKYIKCNYGDKYYAPVRKGETNENAQEGHECLRVINLNMTPADLGALITDSNVLKIYKLIWLRTVQSSMAAAVIGDTQYTINNNKDLFAIHSREVVFDGYRKTLGKDEDQIDDIIAESFEVGEVLKKCSLEAELKQTQPPKRYTEASLIKEMEKHSIGRPSTYGHIIETLLSDKRGYNTFEEKTFRPTIKGGLLVDFLNKYLTSFMDLNYTKDLEKELDAIANGKLDKLTFLKEYYDNLESVMGSIPNAIRTCPKCGKPLKKRKGKNGMFFGCSGWRADGLGCSYTEKI